MLDLPGCQDVNGKLGHLHLVVQLEHAVEVVGTAEPVLKVEFKHWEGGGDHGGIYGAAQRGEID